jgi:serine/threonine protein kinase
MSTKIGHFEILSELSKSSTGAVYKATDSQTNQTVALKAIQLSVFGENASAVEKCLAEEVEATKALSNPNLTPVYGAGEMEGKFCAAMEYIQGNSIATMLARKEGFSIWDLLDIGRQVCSGLDYAHSQNVFHYSLEPGKIMCGWDGGVKILSLGVSSVGNFAAQLPGVPPILYYMSPEQVRSEGIDARSNFFSLGALFYEMVTDRKAFDREDAESLRQSILESSPVPPMHVNPKLNPLLSDLIMKALAKDPNERYQTGRQLLDDLEKCKEAKPQAAKAPAAAPKTVVPPSAAAQAKFIASAPNATQSKAAARPPVAPKPASAPVAPKAETPRKAAAAAAAGNSAVSPSTARIPAPSAPVPPRQNVAAPPAMPVSSSSAVVEEPEIEAPSSTASFTVDPMMAGDAPARSGGKVSFSEMTELPPLKEVYVAPPPPPAHDEPAPAGVSFTSREPEKPKVQPREVAEKALKEIKSVPPSLMIYSIAGAAVVILVIAIALVLHVNHLNSDDDGSRPVATQQQAQTAVPQSTPAPAVQQQPALSAPVSDQPTAEVIEDTPAHTHAASRGRNARKKSAPTAPTIVPGQMSVDSTPQGAQFQIDGKSDPSWVTPFTLPTLDPGQHTVTVSKAGYSSDTRTVNVASSSKAFVMAHLNQLMATLAVASTPPGANVYIDGRDTGKLTPAQVSVDKGQHIILVRKQGYLDETTSAQFMLSQTVNFSPTLRALGNVDDIKTVGKMHKLFGGKEAQGMGTVVVHTQPKGAQVAVNEHVLDKSSPVEFSVDPGNYVVDITLTGYAPIHKVVSVDKGGKAVIDEVMERQ